MFKNLKFIIVICIFIILNVSEVDSSAKNYTSRTTPASNKFQMNSAFPATKTPSTVSGKWQVGRVSRRQYEIINMLYRKTKSFIEADSSGASSVISSKYREVTHKNNQQVKSPGKSIEKSFRPVNPRPYDRPLTPSFIEFYYLDDTDDRVKRKDSKIEKSRSELQNDESKFALLRPPFYLFRVNDAKCTPTRLEQKQFSIPKLSDFGHTGKSNKNSHFQHDYTATIVSKITMEHKMNITENKKLSFILKDRFTPLVPSKPNDRIKFFEIYDSDTEKPRLLVDNKMINNNNLNNQSEQKAYLNEVDHNTDNHDANKTRNIKKHAIYNLRENLNFYNQADITRQNTLTTVKVTSALLAKHSRPAKWSDFPYIAVYIYEPLQVICESASISPHWLVSSATCLHRHHRNHNSNTEGRSAFVSYCGDNWRIPERIAYVKRSFIHPRFQAKDKSRRRLYNIGVIQVVTSMANTCSGWRPVSLMSHQFVANRDGSFATAVGWGLDRYDPRYGSSYISTYPLMMYEGLLYSDSCPGNDKNSKVKTQNEGSMKNIYCLSLPTNNLEENDTVHGNLLLIGGKLVALYLQEERRPWGVQSVQYTGIWRLIPWLLDVAREFEEVDTFVSDI